MDSGLKKIFKDLQAKQYAPVYLIDGEETYYIDQLTAYFETGILQPSERDFNLLVLYGRDVQWQDVVNACRRFPMFAERQVVIIKDAAQLKDLGELSSYIEKPSPTTILLIEHRFKKTDGRSKLLKYVKDKGIYYTSEKIKDEHLPDWIQGYGNEVGFSIGENEARLMAANMGNDLQKIANEIEKIRINVPEEKVLSLQLIQKYIGISKEYNVFDLPDTLTGNDREKLYKMLNYFFANPKSAPMPLLAGTFYSHFNKLYQACYMVGKPEKDIVTALGTYSSRVKSIMATVQNWQLPRVERCLLLISKYSAMSVGINSSTDDTELLKEFMAQMME